MRPATRLVGAVAAVLTLMAWCNAQAGARSTSNSPPYVLIKTAVDPRQDPAGAKFLSCKLYPTQPEMIVARGTFAIPFPYSGGTISVFTFNPVHPGGGGFAKNLPVTHKGARTWQSAFHLDGSWKPTICELAIASPPRS